MATPSAADPFADFPDAPAEAPPATPARAPAASDPFAAFPDAPEAARPQEPSGPPRGTAAALSTAYLVASHAPGGPKLEDALDFEGISSHSPATAEHLSTPSNWRAAPLEYDKLSWLERHLTGSLFSLSREPGEEWTPPKWMAGLGAGSAGVLAQAGELDRELGLLPFSTSLGAERDAAIAHLKAVGELEVPTGNLADQAVVGAARAAPFVAANIVAAAAGGWPAALSMNTGLVYPEQKKRLSEVRSPEGAALDPTIVKAVAAGVSTVEGAAYTFGVGPLAKGISGPAARLAPGLLNRVLTSNAVLPLVTRAVARAGVHGATGASALAFAGALDDATIQAAKVKAGAQEDFDWTKVYDSGADSFKQGMIDFALFSMWSGGRRMLNEAGVRSASLREQEALAGAAKYLEGIKDPEAVEAVVGKVAPGKTALVERSRWDAYWQEKGIDPKRQAAEVAGGGTNPHDVPGDFIALPLSRYLSRFGGSEHLLALAPDVKLDPSSRTAREQVAFDEAERRLETEAQKARGAQFELDKRAVADIIREQAISRGVDADDAAANANTIAEAAGSVAIKTDTSVKQATILMGLQRYKVLGTNAEAIAQATSEQLRASMPAEELHTIDLIGRAGTGDQLAISELGRRARVAEKEAAQAKEEAKRAKAEIMVEPLTQLGSRKAFETYKSAQKGEGWEVAIDVNDLGAQDLFGGHATGNKLLTIVADAMRAAKEKTGHKGELFRWGGDEFHAGGFETPEAARAFAGALKEHLAGADPAAPGYKASVAIGIAQGFEAADAATYKAKAEKKAKWGSFNKANPEAFREKAGHGESFIAEAAKGETAPKPSALPAPPAGEAEIARIGDKPVTFVPPVAPPERAMGRIVTPQRPAGEPIRYRVIEAAELIPSHTPDSFAPHPDYPAGVQERDYRRQPEEQMKVTRGAQQLDPSFLLSDTPSPLDGPPIVTSGDKAIVLGGNGRSMMLLRGIRDPATAERYRAALEQRVGALGISPAAIASMRAPILVREVEGVRADAAKADMTAAVRRFNEGMTQALSPKVRAVAEAKSLTPETVRAIGDVLSGSEGTLRDVMRDQPAAVVEILRRDGIITSQNQTEWVKGRNLTEEGKDRIEGMFVGRVVGTADRMMQTPSALLAKVERIAPALVKVEGVNPSMAETETVQKAIDLLNEARQRNVELDKVVNQVSLFGEERPSRAVVAMARLLESGKPKEIRDRFEAWAARASFDPRQATLFGGNATQAEARAVLLGAEVKVEQPAYHGTPHRGIDKFSLAAMGTGQGAQSYGWGLYFAQNKAVAESYRQQLADAVFHVKGENNRGARTVLLRRLLAGAAKISVSTPERALEEAVKRVNTAYHSAEEKASISALKPEDVTIEAGQVYKVDVPEDSDLLDYDKPLAEQPRRVLARLTEGGLHSERNGKEWLTYFGEILLGRGKDPLSTITGEQLYSALELDAMGRRTELGITTKTEAQRIASLTLGKLGIPGHMYLDAGSRGAKEGTHNYVIWNEEAVGIIGHLYQKSSQTTTPEFKAWFRDSKVVDANGDPIRVFHGAKRPDRVGVRFRRDRATSGPMPFFTDSPELASKYATGKSDTSLEAPSDYAGWFKVKQGRSMVDIDRAWWGLSPEKRAEVAEKIAHVVLDETTDQIRLGGPDEYGLAGKDHWDWTLQREARGNPLRAAVEIWLNSGGLFGDEARFLSVLREAGLPDVVFDSPHAELPGVFPVFLAIQKPLDTSAIPPEVSAALEKASRRQRKAPEPGTDPWDKRGVSASDWMARLRSDAAEGTTHAWTSIPDWVTKTLQSFGYDGIKDVSGKGGGDVHAVWIPFAETQVKSATGNRGTFDPTNPSILKQEGGEGPRGMVRMRLDATGRPMDFPIQLLAGDASTLAHETGHFFSWAMHDVAMSDKGAPAFRADYETLLKWAGFDSPEARLAENLERAGLEAREETLAPAEKGRLADLRAKEEKIGHGWELYFAEGRAPSRQLARSFAWFRRSITDVYRGLFGAGDQYRRNYGRELGLSEEIRGVFDRWLAAETEVSRSMAADPIPAEVLDKLNPADRDALLRARDDRRDETEAGVYQALTQAEKDQHADTRAQVRQQVADELDATPVWRAIDYLTRDPSPEAGLIDVAMGNLSPDLIDASGRSWKLDLAEVKEALGEEGMKGLPRGITARKGGMPLDFLAERLGFQTGEEMLTALKGAGKRDAAIEARTQARMEALFPSMVKDPEAVARAAVEAEHTPEAAVEALVGARILARSVDPALGMRLRIMEDRATRKANAERLVAGTPVSALSPALYLRAERSAGKKALELTGKALGRDTEKRKEYAAEAMDARDVQLLNMELWRAATDAIAKAEKDASTLAEYQRPGKTRAEVGKAHETLEDGRVAQPYLEQIDALLAAVEFGNASRTAVAARASTLADIQQWIQNRWLDGDSIIFPPKLMERFQRVTHWKDLTPTELTSFREAVESIAEQAKQRTTFEVGKQKAETEQVISELAAAALENGANVRLSLVPANKTTGEAMAEGARQVIDAIRRPEGLYEALDGYQTNGPWKRYIWDPISDASYHFHDLVRQASEPVRKILRDMPWSERQRIRNTRFEVNGETYTLENAIVVGLQMGNESNASKLVRGMSDPSLIADFNVQPWNGRETRDAILSQLTAPDVKIINEIHRALESYWEAASALETKDQGVAPKKVQTKPFKFKNKDGVELVIDGGYYPIIYSRMFRIGKRQDEADMAAINGLPGLYDPAYQRVMTPNGHLQERVESYARPFDLTLDALPRKLTMTAKDIAFRMAAKQAYRVLIDQRIVGALQQALGHEGHSLVLGHLRDAVNDVMIPEQGAGLALRVMGKMRSLTYQNAFALNVAQTLQNFADPVGISAVMPPRFFAQAALDIGRRRGAAIAEILAESSEMRLRADGLSKSLNRDIEDTFRKSVPGLAWDRISEVMLLPFETTQKMTEFPTYAGAKAHALEPKEKGGLGLGQEEAVRHAQDMVRKMFGGHRTIDLTPVQRHKILRWGTMFWGWSSAKLDQFITATGKGKAEWSEGRRLKAIQTVAKAFANLYAIQVVSSILVGRGPKDEDDDGMDPADIGEWLAWKGVGTLPSFVPVVSQVSRGLEGDIPQRDVQMTPWLNLLNGPAKAVKKTGAYITHVAEDSEGDDEAVQLFVAWLEAGGQFAGGAPVGQVRKTSRYWMDREPDAALGEDVLGTAYGPSKKGSLSNAIYGR